MKLRPRQTLSPHGLAYIAALLLLLYLVTNVVGFREHVGVLSGTPAGTLAAFAGLVYVLLHFAALMVAPPLLLGAALMAAVLLVIDRGAQPRRDG